MTPQPERPLPRFTEADRRGDQGMRIVERLAAEQLGCAFRDETRRDFGIDCLLELLTDEHEATGRLIAVQVKCGRSYFDEPSADGEGYVFRGESKHLNYWLGHSLPVLVVLCDPETEGCIYTEIAATSVRRTEQGWSTVVPRDRKLDGSARRELIRIAESPQRQDVLELSLLRYLVERWGDRLRICTETEMPRNFHRFPYLIEIAGDGGGRFGVQFLDTVLRTLTVEAVAEEVRWQEHNERATGGGEPGLMLFAIGDDAGSSRPSAEVADYLSAQKHLRWHRLIYDATAHHALHELDDADRILWHWPGDDEPYHAA